MDIGQLKQQVDALTANVKTLKAGCIGVGQKWVDYSLSPDRATDVIYTNDTGRTIVVSIFANYASVVSPGRISLALYVDAELRAIVSSGNAGDYPSEYVTAIVPAGSTYFLSDNSGTAGYAGFTAWNELR